ncbi:ATP-, maltotriose-and DNA-dependent transcriptional regulator MalT [Thermanaeromonas toyohensis ToBE]|uniref:ATP-, maltotriose-and DNA-dependent transcriptional regulator MalT n=1 Tax=Thermanaeromonas toyohensis ToBE TaxID=698762 RepID=A0A1W1W2A7_9FIRM|nr:BTAD domain-containing putative transcriptional regulator [Thermanaeromonas toyohensis]SMB99234.1 ATP-, maltotriose-and DNA-dependent transcriptional regulator MalT [Thermanaeromonas toyohensis ToBE]
MKADTFPITKFMMPSTGKEIILTSRFYKKIKEINKYPLILILAGPGYGKSAALSYYFHLQGYSCFWLNLDKEDNELPVFLSSFLTASANIKETPIRSIEVLKESEDFRQSWKYILNLWINELISIPNKDLYFIIEDYHQINQDEVNTVIEHLIRYSPPNLHLIITSRTPFNFSFLPEWKLKGRILYIEQNDLAFDAQEIEQLFKIKYGKQLTEQEVQAILELTDGWPIAVAMLASSQGAGRREIFIPEEQENIQDLFQFLAISVLQNQPPELRTFILKSAVLRDLNERICAALFGSDGIKNLYQIIDKGLFIHDYGRGTYRFNKLFRRFLLHIAEKEGVNLKLLNAQVGEYFLQEGLPEEAIYHFLMAKMYDRAITIILEIAGSLIKTAQYRKIIKWLEEIPEEIYNTHPHLYLLLGDVKRLTSYFEEALSSYEKARFLWEKIGDNLGVAAALEKKALVFLDTVQPVKADPLLYEAYKIREQAGFSNTGSILELLGENSLNQGKLVEAQSYIARAVASGYNISKHLKARLLLRTGQLEEDINYIEQELTRDESDLSPKSHREIKLVLSLLYSLTGQNLERALELAWEVLEASQRVGSPFTESVAAARIGQVYNVMNELEKAVQWYHRAIELSDRVSTPRGKGEPLWGLTLAYAFKGDLSRARYYAEMGYQICHEVNDRWLAALTELALGIAYYNSGSYNQALDLFLKTRKTLADCGDTFGPVVALLWEALTYWRTSSYECFSLIGQELEYKLNQHGYRFLLERACLWRPREIGELKLFLTSCFVKGFLGEQLAHSHQGYHPGYKLGIKALGELQVYRGPQKVSSKEWRRDKAKRLLEILVTYRGSLLAKEKLMEMLWPEKEEERADSNFKVTLVALNNVLEPRRPGGTSYFIIREGNRYGLRTGEDVEVDVDIFIQKVKTGLEYLSKGKKVLAQEFLEEAIALYAGDYLEDALYEDWAALERERMRDLYLSANDGLARIYLEQEDYYRCLYVCGQNLKVDPCWENAYRLMIQCYGKLRQKTRAVQVYQQYKEAVRKYLGIRPSGEILNLLKDTISQI